MNQSYMCVSWVYSTSFIPMPSCKWHRNENASFCRIYSGCGSTDSQTDCAIGIVIAFCKEHEVRNPALWQPGGAALYDCGSAASGHRPAQSGSVAPCRARRPDRLDGDRRAVVSGGGRYTRVRRDYQGRQGRRNAKGPRRPRAPRGPNASASRSCISAKQRDFSSSSLMALAPAR